MVGRAQRKSLCKLLLKNDNIKNAEYVNLAIARVEWIDNGNIEEARNLFNIVVKLNSDFGDGWAWLYKFEYLQGEQNEEEVLKQCCQVEPRHGVEWCKVSKDPKNWKLKTKDILLCVASKLDTQNLSIYQ